MLMISRIVRLLFGLVFRPLTARTVHNLSMSQVFGSFSQPLSQSASQACFYCFYMFEYLIDCTDFLILWRRRRDHRTDREHPR